VIVAIDESGSFAPESPTINFFVAVHLRQRRTLYELKRPQFLAWERSLPSSAKNPSGEIKSALLSDDDLFEFGRRVIGALPAVGITPYSVRGSDNPPAVLEKHRAVALIGAREGVKLYESQGKRQLAQTVAEFANWLKNLSYNTYLKIEMLGHCMSTALVNTVGHSITGKYDRQELPRIRYKIDRDFIREPRHLTFWRQLLRNQIYNNSKHDPLPLLDSWERTDHAFLETFGGESHAAITEIFEERCDFLSSHEHFEIRIADTVATILNRFWNHRRCTATYHLIVKRFLRDGRVNGVILNDFDLAQYRYDPSDNPWAAAPARREHRK
jgi:hypothetical protein